ncbi:MAG: alpha/beta hydrolase [Anaerolineae bacterium]|nr:alpha/beta hydrolase [Anaerolineae bacterium]
MNHITNNQLNRGRSLLRAVVITVSALLIMSVPVMAQEESEEMSTLPNIVLVHGAFANGSGWSSVIEHLQAEGYNVIAPTFPLTSVEADVARLRQVLNSLTGPTLVVGHSYGGQVITQLGTDAPNVAGLIYVAAFALEEGETINGIYADAEEPAPALANLRVDEQGFAWLLEDDFLNYFASDVDSVQAQVMQASQQPPALILFDNVTGMPAWKSLPSWYLLTTNDDAILPQTQRFMAQRVGATVVEVDSSHVPMVSHPDGVVALIETAAQSISTDN